MRADGRGKTGCVRTTKGINYFLYLCVRNKRYGENCRIKYTGKPGTKDGGVGKLWLPDVAQLDEPEFEQVLFKEKSEP